MFDVYKAFTQLKRLSITALVPEECYLRRGYLASSLTGLNNLLAQSVLAAGLQSMLMSCLGAAALELYVYKQSPQGHILLR
jgi:hypothetical protein